MLLYRDIYSGNNPVVCQEMNLNKPSAALAQARVADVPFIFISRFDVFDMEKRIQYHEYSKRNGRSHHGKVISIMEDLTLDYANGYVIRIGCMLNDALDEIHDAIVCSSPAVSQKYIYPIADKVLDHVIRKIVDCDWGESRHILHIPIFAEETSSMAFRMNRGEYIEISYGTDEYSRATICSVNFDRLFGATERIYCEYANRHYVRSLIDERIN